MLWEHNDKKEAAMARKRLIFFVSADPAADRSPVAAAYRFAAAAASADLDAEVRLAGDAVLVADPAYVAGLDGSELLRQRIDRAPAERVAVSVCPRSVDARGIGQDQLSGIGARPRPLSEILTEVAEGRSVLVHL
jgi:sulfur relay (sulfurtransferase) complex TusBCD TusD component (DsrE family)